MTPGAGPVWPQGYYLNILGKGSLGDIKALGPVISDKKVFSRLYKLCKTFDPRGGQHFWPQGYNLNKLGRGPLGDATYQISRL